MDAAREQMMKDLQLKGITPGTQKKYLREIGFMADYFDKHQLIFHIRQSPCSPQRQLKPLTTTLILR